MTRGAEIRDERDAGRHGRKERPAVLRVQHEHRVHADHDELGVADPDHVDDAEDEIQAEREETEQPAEQDAVHDRLDEEDIEDLHAQSPRYERRMSPLAASAAAAPLERMRPVSSR